MTRIIILCSFLLFFIHFATGQIIYVDPNATGNGNGASWTNAMTDLQTAIDAAGGSASAAFPLQVWVKSGTYLSNTATDKTTSFELKSYVGLYGGFDGTESSLSQRNIATNSTLITGDIGVLNDSSDNIYHAFSTGSSFQGIVVIDGFVISDFYDPTSVGGSTGLIKAVSNTIDSLSYVNCQFINNEIGFGSVYGHKSFPAYFNSCQFKRNGSSNTPTIWNISSAGLTIVNSTFVENNSPVLQQVGKLTLINNTFYNNTGIAVSIQQQSTPNVSMIYNNIFWENSGDDLNAPGNATTALTLVNNLFQDLILIGTNSIIANPQFVDAPNGDLKLLNCSQALNQGDGSVLPANVTKDLNGANRVFGSAIDLGAFESQVSPLLFASLSTTNVVCHGGNTGQINVTAQGGSGQFEYSIDGTNFQSTGTFTGLVAGNYQATIKELGSSCSISQSVTLAEPNAPTIQYSIQASAASNLLTITATGTNSPYDYSIDGTNYSAGPFALTNSGSYTLYARDASSCVSSSEVYLTNSGNQIVFLDPNAAGNNSGSSWSDAFTDLQSAIDHAAISASDEFPTEVWAKAGTYYTTVQSSTNRTLTISMRNNVHLIGGFSGTETTKQQRDFRNNHTVLSGDIGVLNDSTDNSYGMLSVGSDITQETTIDGWRVTGAFSLAVEPTNGAIHMTGNPVALNVKNCTFRFNLANQGACIRMKEVTNTSTTLRVESSTFAENGFYATSTYIGSAIYAKGFVHIENSLMYKNKSGVGGMFFLDTETNTIAITNSTMARNHAGSAGPLMYIPSGPSKFRIRNSILFENTDLSTYKTPIRQVAAPTLHEASNNLSDDNFITFFDSSDNIIGDPQFSDADNFNFRINYCSPAVNAGSDSFLPSQITTDLDNNPRQFNEVDMGAFEVQVVPFIISNINIQQPSCAGGANGSIDLTTAGGSAPVEYSLNGAPFVSSGSFTGMTAGTYSLTAKDANGCEKSTVVTVAEPDMLVGLSNKTNLSCFGSNDGHIDISGSGGTGNITYSIDGGTNFSSTNVFDNLSAGIYNVVLSDANSCLSSPEQVTLTQPDATKTPQLQSGFTSTYGLAVHSDSLTITPDPTDQSVTHFKITNIVNGTLTLANLTAVAENSFISVADAQAGLIFNPSSAGTGSFSTQSTVAELQTCLAGNVVTTNMTIAKATLTTTADDKAIAFGEALPSFSVSYTGFVGPDNLTNIDTPPTASIIAVRGRLDAGTYDINPSGGSDDNYDFNYVSGSLTVNKATLTAAGVDTTIVYGKDVSNLSVTYSGFVGADDLSVIDTLATASSTASAGTDTGSYDITAGGATDNNYDFTYTSGTLTIGKAPITITANDQSIAYGDSIPNLSFTYTGFFGSDDPSVIDIVPSSSTTATIGDNTGSYDIKLTGGSDNNYDFNLVNGTLTINKTSLLVTADNQTVSFGEAIPSLTHSYSGFFGNDDASGIDRAPSATTTATQGSDTGSYDITVSGGSDNNYAFSFTSGTLTVEKANQTINFPALADIDLANDSTLNLGASSSSGLDITYTITTGTEIATVSGDVVSVTRTGTVIVDASQEGNANYNAAQTVDQSFNVIDGRKTDQTITFNDNLSSSAYGDNIQVLTASASSNLKVTYVVTGPITVNNDSMRISGAGEASITAIQEGNDTFNPATPVTLTFTIAKASLTIQANDINITFGDSIPDFTLNYTGFIASDTVSDLDERPTATASDNSDTGEYTIQLSGGTDNNYAFTLIDGKLTIGMAEQTISFNSIDDFDLANGDRLRLEATSNINSSISYNITTGIERATLSGDTLIFSSGLTGNIVIEALAEATKNYKAAVTNETFRVFNSDLQEQTIALGTLVDGSYGDLITLSATASSGLAVTFDLLQGAGSIDDDQLQVTGIGTYIIQANQDGNSSFNAAISTSDTIEISKAPLKVSADEVTISEGDEIPELTLTYEGFVLNENALVLDTIPNLSTDATNESPGGTYAIEVSGGSDDLYEFSYENGVLFIETLLNSGLLENSPFNIYPNPTSQLLHFEASEGTSVILRVISMNGQVVLESIAPNSIHKLDIGHLTEGIYLLEVKEKHRQIIQHYRIIKR